MHYDHSPSFAKMDSLMASFTQIDSRGAHSTDPSALRGEKGLGGWLVGDWWLVGGWLVALELVGDWLVALLVGWWLVGWWLVVGWLEDH